MFFRGGTNRGNCLWFWGVILRCKCGKPFDFERMGSYGPGPDGHVVDGFEPVCKTGKHQITLYMDMHHLGPSSLVPKELRKIDG